jgi:excisionase family DNA binding protein
LFLARFDADRNFVRVKLTELLTTREIARYLKLRPETVLRKVKKGEIPGIKMGGRFRFDKKQIDEWLSHSSTSKKRVLVIDDELIRRLFKETLAGSNYHVMTAEDGGKALKLVKSWKFDSIFLDLKMPGTSGKHLYETIKQKQPSLAKKAAFITGDTVTPATQGFLDSTGRPYLIKPFNPNVAVGLVKEILGGNGNSQSYLT